MAVVYVPCGGSNDPRRRVNLDGVAYDIRTRWNNRSESWFMYFGLADQEPLFKTRMTTGQDLLDSYRGIEGSPDGLMYVLDIEKDFGRPTFDQTGLGLRFRLLYASSEEELLALIPEE